MAQVVRQQEAFIYTPYASGLCPREIRPQASALSAKLESGSSASSGDALWSPSSWESRASFDMLADFLCLADGQESSSSDHTAHNLLQSPGAAIDSGRSSFDSDRTSLSDSIRTSSSALPDRSVFAVQSHQQSLCSLHASVPSSSLSLRLNHEDVLSAWDKLGGGKAAFCHQQSTAAPSALVPKTSSPFIPLVPQDCRQPCTAPSHIAADPSRLAPHGTLLPQSSQPSTASGLIGGPCCGQHSASSADPPEPSPVSRQARLDRYREKKRTRGFSSKIRYEMRKINAERRPRVKGRFVKREDMTESYDEILDPLTDYDPIDFGMLTALDMSEDSYLI